MKKEQLNKVNNVMISLLTGIVILLAGSFLLYVLVRGFSVISWEFLTQPSKAFEAGGGIGIQLFNSLYIMILTLLICLPIALGAGIYLAEYAKDSAVTRGFRLLIEMMSSLPSIVIGLFGYLFIVIKLDIGFSVIAGAISLAILNVAFLTRVVEDAIRSVDGAQREGGIALGLSRWETVTKLLIPSAIPGIVTGVVLVAGRTFGEAAALIFSSGQSAPAMDFSNWNPFDPTSPLNPFRPAETLAVHIWKINSEGLMPDGPMVAAGAGTVLLIIILIFNISAKLIGRGLEKKLSS
ncbi:phosphate ABC transporter permease PstA [Vagococcus coleopterorum]|uniref:Phosphate transport system permease protein PstA n=1 Tax=Vagococcus coleopterorum TaxID=2714946 RepID=A0A6G8ANH0_9ENTE|nr:phosphate ABC transporter permease PstA [Vagococcus coleopterorum]QIL46473.1 phosphate ABC transporter permease PstA [Vagococcus coleopterorum]